MAEVLDLRPQVMIFVNEYIKNNGNGTLAAIAAGYSEKSAPSQASRLLRNAQVKQYLNNSKQNVDKDLRTMFADHAVNAFNVMLEVMNDPDAQHRDKMTAARDLLDRAGYKAVDKIQADVIVTKLEEFFS